MWAIVKLFLSTHRLWFYGAVLVGFLGTAIFYINSYSSMKTRLPLLEAAYDQCQDTVESKTAKITSLNNRIKEINKQKLKEIAEAKARIKAAREAADVVRAERDIITEQLAIARFGIIEAFNDETFADWVDACGDVHLTVWEQLHDTAEGSTTR